MTGADGRYSRVHGISVEVMVMLPLAALHGRAARIRAHGGMMLGLFFGALIVIGAFMLMPGRLMHRVILGS